MDNISPIKQSKIPILKKVKTLKPLINKNSDNCCDDQFKYCRNCIVLKENLQTIEQNFTTILKENNLLRQQLSLSNQSGETKATDYQESHHEDHEVTLPQKVTLPLDSPIYDPTIIDSSIPDCVTLQPYSLIPGHPFSEFNVNALDQEITYSHDVNNRKIKFYGAVPYKYSGVVHEPCSVPRDCYLLKIIDKIKVLFPHFSFNSVLINKYADGKDFIPMHSDDEKCIKQNSEILTVSLGETRTLHFQPINSTLASNISVSLQHGGVFIMSANSQKLFKHGIPQNSSTNMRISLTFRDLTHPQMNSSCQKMPSVISVGETKPDDDLQTPVTVLKNIPAAAAESSKHETVDTIYISSSMFADLDDSKLTSVNHRAAVFYYRGATAGGILNNLQKDDLFNEINPSNIKQVFLLCGTNDIDNILHVRKNGHYNINIELSHHDGYEFDKTTQDIHNLIQFIHRRNAMTKINLINILPRASISRNTIINNLNQYLVNLCNNIDNVNFINTEFRTNLFSTYNGYRKNQFFKNIGSDNVHLNALGIVRLGKHLKYLSHLDCPRISTHK